MESEMIYTYTKLANLDKLKVEIVAALIPLDYLSNEGDALSVFTTLALTEAEVVTLDSAVSAHTTLDMPTIVKNKILAAMDFGRSVMAEYGSSNVLAGLTLEQIQYVMAATAKVQAALNGGSLYVALAEIELVTTDEVIITVEKITIFRNKLQDYLGIART
jgi:hypothetical protein